MDNGIFSYLARTKATSSFGTPNPSMRGLAETKGLADTRGLADTKGLAKADTRGLADTKGLDVYPDNIE